MKSLVNLYIIQITKFINSDTEKATEKVPSIIEDEGLEIFIITSIETLKRLKMEKKVKYLT